MGSCVAVGSYSLPPSYSVPPSPLAGTLVERLSGGSWKVQTTPSLGPSSVLHAVSCASATACVAVGADKAKNLTEEWDGTTWTVEDSADPIPDADETLYAVSCRATTACAAVGGSALIADSRSIPTVRSQAAIAERKVGSTWEGEVSAAAENGQLYGMSCPVPHTCVAVGGTYTLSGGIPFRAGTLVEVWRGKTWTVQQTPYAEYGSLNAVSCPAVRVCVAVGSWAGRAFANLWNGKAWRLQATVPRPGPI